MIKKTLLSALTAAALSISMAMSADDSKVVTVVTNHDLLVEQWLKDVIPAYEKQNPGKKVNLQIIGGTAGDYYTKLVLMLKTDTTLDVIFEDSFMLKGDMAAGLIAPIPEITSWSDWNQFFPSLQNGMTFDGKVYGAPLSTDARGLFYNTEIFKKAGIATPWSPKNWNDIIAAAEKIKAECPGITPFSCGVGANGEGTSMQTAEMFLYGTNDKLYEDGKWVTKSQGFLDMLKFIGQIYGEKNLGLPVAKAISSQYGNIVTQELMPKQKVAIVLDGSWAIAPCLKKAPEAAKNYQMVPMPTELGQAPGFITMSGGWCLAVSAKSQNKNGALDFIKFALNKENLLDYTKIVQNLSTRTDVAEMDAYPENLKVPTSFLKYSVFRPANENYPAVSVALQQAVESVATAKQTPIDAMNQYATTVERTVGKDNTIAKPFKE